jgi:hypothetical protein
VRSVDPSEVKRAVDLGLSQDEVRFLVDALSQFSGPARPSPEIAFALGYADAQEMRRGLDEIEHGLRTAEPLARRDWKRSLIAAEVSFGSDTFGAGVEWETVTGRDEGESLKRLRELQRKLVGVCRSV